MLARLTDARSNWDWRRRDGRGEAALELASRCDATEYTADVIIVDEAWQMTYAGTGGLGPLGTHVVLVSDPGQIAPVVTGDSRRWRDRSAGLQRAAPEALLAGYQESVTQLRLVAHLAGAEAAS
jgi:superfamily I DNA and/or RNA helicase